MFSVAAVALFCRSKDTSKYSYGVVGCKLSKVVFSWNLEVQWNLDLRKPDLRKNLDLRKIVGTNDFLVHKLFDLRKIF